MFNEVDFLCNVTFLAKDLDPNRLVRERSVVTRLLQDLSLTKASKRHGYFLKVTNLKIIGKEDGLDESDNVVIPVLCKCRTFLPVKGEILEGVVYRVSEHGVLLRCGPVKYVFLSARKMPNYHYIPGENPVFMNDDLSRIQNDVVVLFYVLDARWVDKMWDMRRDFKVLASLEGDALGPVSLCGSDALDL